jgi:hypothetical protein
MSEWHMSFGMGEHWGGYLSWGFGILHKIKKVIMKVVSRLIPHKRKRFILKIPITGDVSMHFEKLISITGQKSFEILWTLLEDED